MKTELSKIAQDLEQGTIGETEARTLLFGLLGVSGSLPMLYVHELNELIKAYNKEKPKLIDFISRVWNKAYNLGYWNGR